jgi:hypothetical protein
MAIAPIDLQTLFTQLDKVGKAQMSQREGLAMQQAIQGVQIQKKTEEHIQEVNEAQNTGEGVEKVNERGRRNSSANGRKNEKGQKKEQEEDGTQPSVLSDPTLGRKIDISL